MAKRKDPIERFWSHVEKTPTCWLWTGARWTRGYGRMFIDPDVGEIGAHVFSYELHYGRARFQVCHSCDVRNCVRPDHLWDGTQQQNLDDMSAKGRSTRGEASAMVKLTEEQARFAKTSSISASQLAARWGVTPGAIHNIRSGASWRWL
jgi:hypothetical protein